jgi:hypothetical protein
VSDFFANLAARAVEGSATIRPRLAMRFEPVAPPEPVSEVIVETTGPETGSATPMAPVVEKAPAVPTPPESPPTASVAVAPRAQGMASPPAAPIALTEPPPGRSAVLKSPQPDEDVAATVSATIVSAPSAAALPEPAPRDAAPAPELPSTLDGDRVAGPPITEKTSRTAAPATPPFPVTLSSPSLRHEVSTVPAPGVVPVKRPEQSPVETIVHVSIGRIELRAPPTLPATRRERAVPAVTTLAEYLQQRARK